MLGVKVTAFFNNIGTFTEIIGLVVIAVALYVAVVVGHGAPQSLGVVPVRLRARRVRRGWHAACAAGLTGAAAELRWRRARLHYVGSLLQQPLPQDCEVVMLVACPTFARLT